MRISWWAKLSIKLVLSRLPLSYSSWFRLGLFRHGTMVDERYARKVFQFHAQQLPQPPKGAVCLELGPGDSLFTAISARQAGFARTILIDAGRYASDDLPMFSAAARNAGIAEETVAGWKGIDDALRDLDAVYLTAGLASLRSLPDNSVHLIFSQAVLEHIRKREYAELVAEMKRVLAPGGVTSHQIDLQDHLSGGLNNLRFGDSVWEGPFFRNASFYTNRISHSEHCRVFEEAGFRLKTLTVQKFDRIPIDRRSLARQFQDRSDEDLAVLGFHLVATA